MPKKKTKKRGSRKRGTIVPRKKQEEETKQVVDEGMGADFLSDDDEVAPALLPGDTKDVSEDARARLKARLRCMASKRGRAPDEVDGGGMAGAFTNKGHQKFMQRLMNDVEKYGDEAYKVHGIDRDRAKQLMRTTPGARQKISKALGSDSKE